MKSPLSYSEETPCLRLSTLSSIVVLLLLTLMISSNAWCYKVQDQVYISPPDKQVEVNLDLYINKLYNVNSVEETYDIDGYLVFQWQDERLAYESEFPDNIRYYENEKAVNFMGSGVWVPAFDFINIQGKQDVQHMVITTQPDGSITYEERFFGTFHTEMDFRKFPFDDKTFVISIEPFSYEKDQIIFGEPKLQTNESDSINKTLSGECMNFSSSRFRSTDDCEEFYSLDGKLGKDWDLIEKVDTVGTQIYSEGGGDGKYVYSKAIFEIKASRKSNYFVFQVLIPLLLIIIASFSILWIHDFETQIGVGFSLMLTVVAFNFYSATILPELPYNTFIENVITSGYLTIAVMIIFTIINHNRLISEPSKSDWRSGAKKLFIFAYLFIMGMIIIRTFFW